MFQGVPFLEGVYTPEVLGQGLLDASIATGKGVAKAFAGPYDLLNLAAGGAQQGINYLLTEGEALGRSALGFDPEVSRQIGAAQSERISQTTDFMSPRAAMDRLIATPQGYENLEFGTELAAGLVTPIVPFAPKVRPPIRAPQPGLRTPTQAAGAAGAAAPSPVPEGSRLTQGEIDTAIAGMAARGETEPVGTLEATKKVSSFAKDYLQEAGLTWGGKESGVPFSEFFRLHYNAGTLSPEKVEALYQKYGIKTLADFEELVTGSVGTVSKAGKTLREWRATSAPIPRAAAEEAKTQAEKLPGQLNASLWRRMGNASRAALVAEISKTTRDLVGAAWQVPIDIFANTVDNLLVTALNPMRRAQGFDTRNVNFGDAFVFVSQALKPSRRTQGKNLFEQLREKAPNLNKKVLDLYNADVARPAAVNDAFSKIEKGLDVLNFANRWSDGMMRRVAFPAFLRRAANRAGFNYDELVANQQIHTLPEDIMERAIDDTLKFVFAKKPEEGGELFLGSGMAKFVDMVESFGPVGAAVVGFPKFIANSLNYTYRFSPAGAARLFTEKGMKRFDEGDTTAISEAITGAAMLYTAIQFRNSEYAGTQWFQARDPETGREFDLRPFFPIGGAHLFLADLALRAPEEFGGDGTFDKAYTAKDVIQGFTGAQGRAGTSEYLIDEGMQDIRAAAEGAAAGEGSRAMESVGKATGSFLGGLVPFGGTMTDLVAQIDPEQRVVRDTSFSPFLGQALREIPYAQSELLGLPESQYVGRDAPMTREDPLLRQITGAALKPEPTNIEKELGRLGIKEFNLYDKTGVPQIDNRMKQVIGALVDNPNSPYNVSTLLNSPGYLLANTLEKTDLIEKYYKNIREIARERVDQENPAYEVIRRYRGLDREGKIVADSEARAAFGKSTPAFVKQLSEAPLVASQQALDALPSGTKYTDPGDYKVYTKK
jgi:hypothetical protein